MNLDEKNIKLYLMKNNLKVELIGIMAIIIISKDLIKRNHEVGEFIKKILEIEFPEYVVKSRTLMAARVNRILINIDDEREIKKVNRKILRYLDTLEKNKESEDLEKIVKKAKKENENDKLKKWLKGLGNA